MKNKPSENVATTELENLRARLDEAESILNAIRNGEVDALLVTSKDGEQVHTLSGSYRHLIETMGEGAATLSADGAILYCNARLTEILGISHDQLLGTPLQDYLQPADLQILEVLLARAHKNPVREELNLKTSDGHLIPVYLSTARMQNQENVPFFNIVVTDLTEQKKNEKIVQAELLARLNLEQAERFNRAAVGRELRMIELKEEINDLHRQQGRPEPYVIHTLEPELSLPEPQSRRWVKKLFGRRCLHEN